MTGPLRDPVLHGAIVDILGRADRALERRPPRSLPSGALLDDGVARRQLASRLVGVAEALRRPTSGDNPPAGRDQLVDLLLELQSVAERVEAATAADVRTTVDRLDEAGTLIRATVTLDELLDVAQRAVLLFGFDRVILSAVRDGYLVPEHCTEPARPTRAEEIVRMGTVSPALLDRSLRETDMVRSRQPIVVRNARVDRRGYRELARITGWSSYVAAPVVRDGDIVGFIHADRGDASIAAGDPQVLSVLATTLGMAFERHAAAYRTRVARSRIRHAVGAIESAFDPNATLDRAGWRGDPRPEVAALLTTREIEVLRLMASGATNPAIAATLVIAEGTAKTHVMNILRKLEVGNRAEAVSRYLGGVDDGDDLPQ
ncbi:MAG: LuxR C-terminal-related transcriptional regulator [Solirubrobacteraceae bacterium]